MKSKSALEIYLSFRKQFVISFCKELLPKNYYAQNYFNLFEKIIEENYLKFFFNQISLDDLITDESDKESILKIFSTNKISNKELQLIYILLFKKSIIESWVGKLDEKQEKIKKVCNVYATTIYLALQFDKYIELDAKSKVPFSKAKKEILLGLKGFFNEDTLKNLNANAVKLKLIFDNNINKNIGFLKNYCINDNLKLRYHRINKVNSPDNTNMYLSESNYSIKELKDYSKKEISKIELKSKNVSDFKKVEIEKMCYDLFKNIHSQKKYLAFTNLPDCFMTKSNVSFIVKTTKLVKENIIFNISYDQFINHSDLINSLKENGINIGCIKTDKEISFKKLYDIKYCFLNYANDISFSKTINELKLGKIKSIILNYSSISNDEDIKNLDFYVA